MALYRLSLTPVKRSEGHSMTAGAAYRAGEKIRDARTGITHDYERKGGVFHSEILTPDGALAWTRDRSQLWNKAELADTRWDARPGRELLLALQAELTDEQNIACVIGFLREEVVSMGIVTDFSCHRASPYGDQRNDHVHVYLPTRELDGEGFSRTKNRDWNKTEVLEHWRERWAVHVNRALEDAGSEVRVDHRTLEVQGSDREPTWHLGKDRNTLERRGVKTELGDRNREIEKRNREAIERKRYMDHLVKELAAVEAELAEELAKEFTDGETFADVDIEHFPADPEEEEPPPTAPPAARELDVSQEPPPTVSIFDSPSSKKFARELKEKGYIGEEFPDYPDEEEELEEPAFAEASAGKPEPEEGEEHPPTVVTENSLRFEAPPGVSIFDSPLSKRFEREIREYGEVKEYGLGKNWYDRTVAFWQDVYGSTSRFVKDTWQKYVSDRKDRDTSPGREGDKDTVDRAKGFWQKYIKGGGNDPGRDDHEPER